MRRWVLYSRIKSNLKQIPKYLMIYFDLFLLTFFKNNHFNGFESLTEKALMINKKFYQQIFILVYRMLCLLNALHFY